MSMHVHVGVGVFVCEGGCMIVYVFVCMYVGVDKRIRECACVSLVCLCVRGGSVGV